METKPFYKQIKKIPFIFLFIVLSGLILSVCYCVGSIGETRGLHVNTRGLKVKTVKHLYVDDNLFSVGYEGELYFRINTLKEAFLVALTSDAPINFYDLLYFLIIDVILFIMVYRVNEEVIFSDQLSNGIKLLGYSVILYPGIILLGNYISKCSIEELTHGQFTSQYRNLGVTKYLYISYLILFCMPIIQKAINLEKEQSLTV